jgi:DNA (cytosine-5)-methyltransferase 1
MKSVKAQKKNNQPQIISLFSGAGGLDQGFKNAGFKTVWANEYDKTITPTFKKNFPEVTLNSSSITRITDEEIEALRDANEIAGVIGGPPCQSWSEAGARRGINDHRGQLFNDYIRFIRILKPKFFVAENVHGLIHSRNKQSFENIKEMFRKEGYVVDAELLLASDFEVPQDRERVFIIGYRKDLDIKVTFPVPLGVVKKGEYKKITIADAIKRFSRFKVGSKNLLNHDLSPDTTYSPIYMSRNRVRRWDQQSFTILATDRHIPIHPSAPPMEKIGKDKMRFKPGEEIKYRRLTVRECAAIQTFPEDFEFIYTNIRHGYKMIGNAVPVKLAEHVAQNIQKDLKKILN